LKRQSERNLHSLTATSSVASLWGLQKERILKMSIKIIIKRKVPNKKIAALIPLLNELRKLAMDEKGYISGETLKRVDSPGESLVISTWESIDAWRAWVLKPARADVQDKIDALLGEKTQYEIYTLS
jgi:quinol monooxygenase YgiN